MRPSEKKINSFTIYLNDVSLFEHSTRKSYCANKSFGRLTEVESLKTQIFINKVKFSSSDMGRGYKLTLDEKSPISDIKFPDIIKLGPIDRDYDLVTDSRGNRQRQVPDGELPRLEVRSLFYHDLSIPSFDQIFMDGGRDNYGNYRRNRESLVGIGAPKVLHALRTFTTDLDVINYRLDVQEDFQNHPQLIPAVEEFYMGVNAANALHYNAFQRDYQKQIVRDAYGRPTYRNWFDLPKSFLALDGAITKLEKVLETVTSEGMKEVREFLERARQHPVYRALKQNLELLVSGSRYNVSFQLDMEQGLSHVVQLGLVPKGSALEQLIDTTPNLDGTTPQNIDPEVMLRRFTGLIRQDIGHVIEGALNLDFDSIPLFCKLLTESMADQLSFYATLGQVYSKYEELGIPVCRPVVGEGKGIEIRESVHPVVAWETAQKGKKAVLNDFVIAPENNFIVLTGPNDGGKSCYGKDVAWILDSAQSGTMTTAKYVRIGTPVRDIYTHFVQQDDIEKGKGAHRNELSRARKIAECIGPQDFLLFDEPCGRTDSESGYHDSRVLIGYAHAIGLSTVFITHLHQLSATVGEGLWAEIRNMQAEIVPDGDGEELTHRIIEGRAKHSYGSRISKEEGVTPEALTALLHLRIASGDLDPKKIRREDPIF